MLFKRLDLGVIVVALITLAIATGCNDNNKTAEEYEEGDTIKITEQILLQCEEPFVFHVVSDYNTSVTIETHEEEDVIHAGNFGVDIKYVVLSECNVTKCPDKNKTVALVAPVDGICPVGFVLSDCNANECLSVICDKGSTLGKNGECAKDLTCGNGLIIDDSNTCVIPVGDCGEGTEYNTTSELCEAIPPLECGIGLINIENQCIAKVYKLEDDECDKGYIEGQKGYFCFYEDDK